MKSYDFSNTNKSFEDSELEINKKASHSKDDFMAHRKRMEQAHLDRIATTDDPFQGLLTIEVNTTELCNRKCSFCPRVDPKIYPNQPLNMSIEVAKKIASNIGSENYKGRISFSGYGENLMNNNFANIVSEFRKALSHDVIIECNTNGDFLTSKNISNLYESGMTYLYVNLYDDEVQVDKFNDLFKKASAKKGTWTLRRHFDEKDYGLFLNNRSGLVKWIKTDSKIDQQCFYPFYKMMVDYNGNVLFCSNDWGREHIVGNLLHHSVRKIWLSEKMHDFRIKLISGDRNFSPCNNCSVDGRMIGMQSAELYMKTNSFN